MPHRTLSIMAVASLLGGAVPAGPALPPSVIEVSAETPGQAPLAAWAIERFEMAGLELPPVSIEFAAGGDERCGGNPARTYSGDTPTVVMCWDVRPFTLLHELAHVWVARNVPPADREVFMAMRDGVRAWTGPEVPWRDRGSEHAANVIAWGLGDTAIPDPRTLPTDDASMRAAFRHLTGTEPLHEGERPRPSWRRATSPGGAGPAPATGR